MEMVCNISFARMKPVCFLGFVFKNLSSENFLIAFIANTTRVAKEAISTHKKIIYFRGSVRKNELMIEEFRGEMERKPQDTS